MIKLMRELYQILYIVGRLTYAPGRRAFSFPGGHFGSGVFPFQGDTLAVELSLSGGHFGSGAFPFQGDTLAWAGLRGGKALRVTKPVFPPRAPPFRARRCSALWYVRVYWQNSVCFGIGSEGIVPKNTNGRKAVCIADLFLIVVYQGTGPLRGPLSRPLEQKNRLSLTLPVQQHTALSR